MIPTKTKLILLGFWSVLSLEAGAMDRYALSCARLLTLSVASQTAYSFPSRTALFHGSEVVRSSLFISPQTSRGTSPAWVTATEQGSVRLFSPANPLAADQINVDTDEKALTGAPLRLVRDPRSRYFVAVGTGPYPTVYYLKGRHVFDWKILRPQDELVTVNADPVQFVFPLENGLLTVSRLGRLDFRAMQEDGKLGGATSGTPIGLTRPASSQDLQWKKKAHGPDVGGYVTAADVFPDAKNLLLGTQDGRVLRVPLELPFEHDPLPEAANLTFFKDEPARQSPVQKVFVSNDGNGVFAVFKADHGSLVAELSPKTLTLSQTFSGHTASHVKWAFADGAQWLVTISSTPENAIRIWDRKERRLREQMQIEADPRTSGVLAAGSPFDTITCAQLSPNGKYLVTGTQRGNLTVWQMPTGKVSGTTRIGSPLSTLSFSGPGNRLLAGTTTGDVRVFDFPGLFREPR